jgi:hypothetical protein
LKRDTRLTSRGAAGGPLEDENSMSKTVRGRLLASTIMCGAVMAAAPAFAQTAAGQQPTEDLTASGGAPVESLRGQQGVTSDAQAAAPPKSKRWWSPARASRSRT